MPRIVIAFGLLVSFAQHASGGLVTWEFAGHLTEVRDEDGSLGDLFSVGMPFSGSYTFDPETPDVSPGVLDVGRYDEAVKSISGLVGDVPFLQVPGLDGQIIVLDNFGGDSYSLSSIVEFLQAPIGFSLLLADSNGNVFGDDSLPSTPPDLTALDSTLLRLELQPDGDMLFGEVLFLVPEPGTLGLLMVGAITLARRKKKCEVAGLQ